MPKVTMEISPGGMLSDVAQTELGKARHQEVKNLRIDRQGEWKSVRGYLNSLSGLTDVRAAIELSEDISGNRCIVYQNGYGASCLKRVDYDSGDGDGYQNESPVTLTLPSGVTIPDVTLRFFYNNGILRITGGSHPLWYAYTEQDILDGLIRQIDVQSYRNPLDHAEWLGTDATIDRYDHDTDLDAIGEDAVQGTYSMSVDQTAADGYARRTFTTVVGKEYTVSVYALGIRKPGLYCGTTQGGTEYGSDVYASSPLWPWQKLSVTFTATGTTLHVSLVPDTGAFTVKVFFDMFIVEEEGHTVFAGWNLLKAEVTDWATYTESSDLYRIDDGAVQPTKVNIYYALFFILDNSQYTLPIPLDTRDLDVCIETCKGLARRFQVRLDETDYFDGAEAARITGVGLLSSKLSSKMNPYDPDMIWYVADYIDLVSELETYPKMSVSLNMQFKTSVTPSNCNNLKLDTDKFGIKTFDNTDSDDLEELGGYMYLRALVAKGLPVDVIGNNGSVETRIKVEESYCDVPDPGSPTVQTLEIYFEDDVSSAFDGAGPFWVTFRFHRVPSLVTISGDRIISFNLAVDGLNPGGTTYEQFTGIPAGTLSTNPNYEDYVIAEGRAWCNSLEPKEDDAGRYSPVNQYDVFPDTFLVQTQFGDIDRIRALVSRDNKIVILKRHSISQMQYSGTAFYTDIGIAESGLYPTRGHIVIEGILFYMDRDEVYSFAGRAPVPMLADNMMRKYYADNVSESSFFAWNRIDRELWLFLSDKKILVYQTDMKSWYIRTSDVDLIAAFNIFSNELYAFSETKFVCFNHEEDDFDENIQAAFKTLLIIPGPLRYKKLLAVHVLGSGNYSATIKSSDPAVIGGGGASVDGTLTMNEDDETFEVVRLNHTAQQHEIEFVSQSKADLALTIWRMLLEINLHGAGQQ